MKMCTGTLGVTRRKKCARFLQSVFPKSYIFLPIALKILCNYRKTSVLILCARNGNMDEPDVEFISPKAALRKQSQGSTACIGFRMNEYSKFGTLENGVENFPCPCVDTQRRLR